MKDNFKNNKGFTLIEVLIIIFLLAILALIVSSMTISNYKNLDRSKDTVQAGYVTQQIIEEWKDDSPNYLNYNGFDSSKPNTLPKNTIAKANCQAWQELIKEVHPEARLTLVANMNSNSNLITLYTLTLTLYWPGQKINLTVIIPINK